MSEANPDESDGMDVVDLEEEFRRQKRLLKAYQKDIRLKIILLLGIYGELDLPTLSDITQKSKPTILRHINVLIEEGFVQGPYHKNPDKQPGNLKRNYYKLIPEQLRPIDITQLSVEKDPKVLADLLRLYSEGNRIVNLMIRAIGQMFTAYAENLQRNVEEVEGNLEELRKLADPNRPIFNLHFFSEEKWGEVQKLVQSFYTELIALMKEDKGNKKPLTLGFLLLPLRELIELESRL